MAATKRLRLNGLLTMIPARFADHPWLERPMSVSGLPLFEALKQRMSWHHARQRVLGENVANADTPGFRPMDVKPPIQERGGMERAGLRLAATAPGHMGLGGLEPPGAGRAQRFETTPSGNAVNLEDEMLKVAQNNQDYQLAASLYQRSMALMKTAIGRGR
jgi:flagellar basal-body rod protein FlgB